ncbi:cilia- and flagella-associated protein 161-like [Melanaphis sacchari]|uniref:cilia- and flagella-associated protein 161-like n=1 Tax=Melanaphis sacchari TaxID=742174 RepID=UPI000DC14E9B|nr:cilia- and flagella-associated protein 161-like [Melanaphis sacchari]
MNRGTQQYSVNVRIGNWVEETHLQSEKIKSFLSKRDRGELLVQKSQRMYSSLLRPVVLNSTSEFLRYGEDAQLVCSDIRFPGWNDGAGGVALSCSTSDYHSELDGMGPGCTITASPLTESCVRNCFKICGIGSNCEKGEPLMFGDMFTISPCISSKPLFVAASMPHIYTERGVSGHPALKLVDTQDVYCRWTVAYWRVSMREEAKGLPVPNGARVVLKHAATNLNAAVETDFRIATFFGDEYEVTAHSYKDVRGCEMAQNIWEFVTSSKRSGSEVDDGMNNEYKNEQTI